ncbi:pyruvate kinase [Arenibacter sp. BSSL-BM3]|uniref:Pyruvate kinase n=1 Tax=Arenibacter arenosicollis TaxID=2762274 RepID=A0ABR7QSF8_9FLAO|nr:pyruvate kinase [Arenibacter arenosicollis]MBC8769905.1 pyruvate kinase [Arenibacter arenosicollis]
MEELKVGDKLYNVSQNGFGDFFRYSFSEVVRLTKTLAVLDNGERLRNKPVRSLINGDIGFALASNRWVYWHIVSGEIEQLAHEENEKIVINDWFKDRTFSASEKKMIFNLFKEKGILKGSDKNLDQTIELFKKL